MRRLLLCLAVVLPGCTAPQPKPEAAASGEVPTQCRVGPDGGPVADRGIGGTGIVGVVTGFASICVNGAEVAYDATVPVRVDDRAATPDSLRIGQLVAVEATGVPSQLTARSVAVRHEVAGPVQTVSADGTLLTVAGQRVILDGPVPGAGKPLQGEWIAVSGLLGPGGAIHATRIDPSPQGEILVHGTLRGTAGAPLIGMLHVSPLTGAGLQIGTKVVATGRYADGRLQTTQLVPDLLASDPPAYFGPGTTQYSIEGFLRTANGRIALSDGYSLPAGGFAGLGAEPRRAVLSFARGSNGALTVTGMGTGGQAPAPDRSAPAPVVRQPGDARGSPSSMPVRPAGPGGRRSGGPGEPLAPAMGPGSGPGRGSN